MAAAAGLAAGFLGPLINPIARQFNYLCCFTSNINSLKDEAKKLDDALAGLEGEVEIGRDNVLEPVPAVQSWLDDSKKINDEIKEILNEATNVGTGCSKLGARFSLSKKAKKTTDRTKVLRGEKPEAEFKPGPIAAVQGVQLEKTFECESRKKIEEDIMTTLRDGDVNMIGICGMGGLGKTTMAKKIMNRVLKDHVFEEVVIATVSQNVDISKIQDEIGGQLQFEKLKEERSQPARVQILHSRLSDTKRILIVLDDVWERLVLEDFGIPRDSEGCTILLTSRNSDVLRAMEVQIFGMEVLSKEEAWSFFREKAGTCVDDRELNPIAKEVAKECGGLPIALAIVGRVLKQQRNAANWKNALRELKQRVPDTVRFDKEVYNSLKWTYNRLNSKLAQSLFLLCCLFPEYADIPLEYLTNFCMGLGIFEDITIMNARDKTCALTDLLKDRSLLLDSDKKDCVRMHDVVRDVCTFIAKEEGYIGKDGCTWISSSHLVGERNELLSGSRCPNLRLLFLDSDDSLGFKFDDAFLEGIRELHVLCIERYSLTTLPHPTQSLGKLNTLILDSCEELETISVVGELVNLEILICRNCNSIEKLPSEMKGLNRLKLLELTWCRKLQSIGRGIISSLVGLEELKMHESFDKWEAEDREERENAGLRELVALTNLARLEIDIKDPSLVTENMPFLSKKIVRFIIRTDGDSAFPSKFCKAMSLCLKRETCLGDWMIQFLRETECLKLRGEGANNVDLARIQNIRWLELGKCESMKNVVRTSGGDDATVFPSIEHLKLYDLDKLEEICDGPISSTSFQNLKEFELYHLKALTQFWKSSSECQNNYVPPLFKNLSSIDIWACKSLRNLGQLSMAGKDCLPQLKQLCIRECEMMEQVFLWNDENKTSIESQRNCHVITKVFLKLKKMELYDLPKLTIFYQEIQGIEFPLLREMKIKECPKMKRIIGSSSADIDENDCLHLLCQPQKISFGSNLKVLEINHNPLCGHEIPSSLVNGLEVLTINKYEGSMSLFTLSMAENLVSLRELSIENCDEMIKVIEDEQQERILLFPKLEILRLKKLPKLVSFCDWKCEVELPSLKKADILRCPSLKKVWLEDLPNLTTFCPGIQGIEFPVLSEIKIEGCPKMKSIIGSCRVDIDEDGSLHLLCQPQKISFGSSLKVLVINHNPLCGHEIPSSLFNGLEELTIKQYVGNTSPFTLLMAANLGSLRKLSIENCDEMIKVIEDEQQLASGGQRILLFPELEILRLINLPKLVSFCDWKCEVELPLLREVDIQRCPNMENLRLGLVAAPKMEAFTTDLTTYVGVGVDVSFDSVKKLEIRDNENPLYHHKICISLFNGLEMLRFTGYKGSTMSLFSSSAVEILVNLKVLFIANCDEILVKVIEDEEEEEEDDEKVVSGGERMVVFPKLEELYLLFLPKLMSFCEWKCDVELPSLTNVEIYKCPNMENFSMGLVAAPNLKIVEIDSHKEIGATKDLNGVLQQHYLSREKVSFNLEIDCNPFYGHKIPSSLYKRLEELRINNYKGSMSLFTLSMAENLGSLRELCIENCDEMIKVIEDEHQVASGGERILLFPKLVFLQLEHLPKLESFCDWKCGVELPLLKKAGILRCPSLKKVWLEDLPNLTTFYQGIQGIEFPLLREMKIKECPKMKRIIGSCSADIDENDCLHLLCQPQKISFGSTLKVLDINHNPLCGHEISSSVFNGLEELRINKYVGSMSLFTLSMARNLVSLRELSIENCDEMIKVIEDEQQERILLFPKLEILKLKNLPKLESFCDWKCEVELPSLKKVWLEDLPNLTTFYQGIQGIEFPVLSEMKIKECPKMKSIIGSSSADIDEDDCLHLLCQPQKISFGSLKVLEINHNPLCRHEIPSSFFNGLEELTINMYVGSMSLFTLSMARNLVSLRELRIENCDEMIKVIEDEQQERILLFPKLEILKLKNLPKLVSFCNWKCELELPLLRKVVIQRCPNMENFSMGRFYTRCRYLCWIWSGRCIQQREGISDQTE